MICVLLSSKTSANLTVAHDEQKLQEVLVRSPVSEPQQHKLSQQNSTLKKLLVLVS